MAAKTVSLSVGVQWTPPGAALNSGNASYNLSSSYNAQNVGEVDVPGATAPATVIPIPFGQVQSCKLLLIKNMMSNDIGIRINGAVADNFQVATGTIAFIAMPQSPVMNPVASLDFVTTATPGGTETVAFFVFGD